MLCKYLDFWDIFAAMFAMRLQATLTLTFSLLAGLCLHAQDATPKKSLAEMAAQANPSSAEHARVVLNDDSSLAQKPLFPDVWEGDCDNTDAILAAIKAFRQNHTKVETENEVYKWYEKHALMLNRAADEDRRIRRGRENRYETPYDYDYMNPADYDQYNESRRAASHSAYDDQWRYEQNYQIVYRTETVFQKVRYGLHRMGMDFDWFKIRCGLEYCTY